MLSSALTLFIGEDKVGIDLVFETVQKSLARWLRVITGVNLGVVE